VFRDKLRSLSNIFRKESRTWGATIQLGLDQPVWTPRDYENLTKAGYQLNADVYSCVSLIAGAASQIPWIVYESEGATEASPGHPLARLLRKPNERDTGSEFTEAAIAYLLLSGNAYVERSGGTESTAPAFLYTVRPDRMRVIKGNRRQLVSGYTFANGAIPVKFDDWEIMHLRLFNPLDDYYGMSPMEAAVYTVDNANEAGRLYKKLLQRGYPPGAVSVEGDDWTDEQIKQFKSGLQRATESNQVLYLGNAKWQEMGFKPVDASLFESRRFNKRDIAAVFKVPSEMIGDTESKTYANYQQANKSFYTEAVVPNLKRLRDGLNNFLGPVFGNAYIDIDLDRVEALAEDREVTAKRVVALFEKGLIKRNEGRAELNFDAVPEDEDGYYPELVKVPQTVDSTGEGFPGPAISDNGSESDSVGLSGVGPDGKGRQNSIKAFNLVSEEEKDNHWKAFEAQRERWYERIAAEVGERFDQERNAVLKAFRDGQEAGAIRAVTKQEDAWLKFYRATYFAVAEEFGRRVLNSLKSDGYEHEVKFEQDIFTRTVTEWLATEGAKRVVGVLDTTKDKIRRELLAGQAAGESIFQLSKRLQAMYGEFSNIRAERIARTEVISAASLGSQTAARATNLPLLKEWISTRDSRVRDSHGNANGQVVKIDEPYIIGGYKMMHPGDSSMGAPGDEIIQCRCSESYKVSRG
jgi:HK97 family phage portal protein